MNELTDPELRAFESLKIAMRHPLARTVEGEQWVPMNLWAAHFQVFDSLASYADLVPRSLSSRGYGYKKWLLQARDELVIKGWIREAPGWMFTVRVPPNAATKSLETALDRKYDRSASALAQVALKFGVRGTHTPAELQSLRHAQGNACAYCGMDLGDYGGATHVIPCRKGGSDAIDNIVYACKDCLRAKGLFDWMGRADAVRRLGLIADFRR